MNVARTPSPPAAGPTARPACPGLTRAGRSCLATPTRDGLCPNHSTKYTAEERSSWGRRGALSNIQKRTVAQIQAMAPTVPEAPPAESLVPVPGTPSFATATAVREYLERMTALVAVNRLAPSQATAIAQLAGLALKLVELQLDRDMLDFELAQAERADARPPIRLDQ